MPPARKKHVLVCIICLKRVESKVELNQVSFQNRNRTPCSGDKDDPLLVDDLSGHGQLRDEKKEKSCEEESRKSNLYRRFLMFIHQYFKDRLFTDRLITCAKEAKSEDGTPAELETFCESCGDLVSEICGLYKQLRSAELLLVWRLTKVGELMKVATFPKDYKLKKELWTLIAKQMNLNVVSPVYSFRKTLKEKCTLAGITSLPDVTVHRGLIPDEWKFTYGATRHALVRLIVVFILGSSQFRSKVIKASIDADAAAVNKNDRVFASHKPCPKSRKKINLNLIPVKIEPVENNDAFIENVDDENEISDNLGNDSDSDWSQGVVAASPMSAFSDVPSDIHHESSIKTRRRTLGNRRNIIVKAEEDSDKDEPTLRKERPFRSKATKSNEKRELKCPQCPHRFMDRRGLSRHLRCTHRNDTYYDCQTCGMRFNRRLPFLIHSKEHLPKRYKGPRSTPLPCPKCSIVFPNKAQMLMHHKKYHKTRSTRHECPYCFKKTFDEKTHQLHMENHEQKIMLDEVDIWYCAVCGSQFFKEENLKFHMTNSHEDKYICTICNEKLDTGKSLRDHLITHETKGDKPFQCHICLKGFTTKQLCDIHRKLAHMDKWKFVCDFGLCSDIFDTIPEFNEHLKCHLNEQEVDGDDDKATKQILFCKTCNLGFLKESNLTLHELWHSPENKSGTGYNCPKCNKILPYKELLTAHFNFMHGEKLKPFQCRVCDKYLANARWFRAHIRLHEERLSTGKFICDICGIRCVDSIGLSAHRQIHNYKQESKSKRDARVAEDLRMGRKRMKLIWRQTEIDLMVDPSSPPPPGSVVKKVIKKRKKKGYLLKPGNPGIKTNEEKKLELNLNVTLSCDVENCGVTFDSGYLLRKHLENEHEAKMPETEKNIPCYHCYKKFCYQQSREIHVRVEHKNKIYGKFKCDSEKCEEEPFLSVEELNDHLKSHLGGGLKEISICGTCDWGFVRPEVRELHRLVHIPPDSFGRFQCPLCPENCAQLYLRAHYTFAHGTKLAEHICELCGRSYLLKSSLRLHKRMHLKQEQLKQDSNPLKCFKCDIVFENEVTCANHVKKFHFDKKLKCSKCSTIFEDQAILLAHVKEHHPENYHICEVDGCGRAFSNKGLLWAHAKYKHQTRRFICDLCGMAFYTQHHLTGHMTIHKPKTISCDLCGKMFRREKHLERHMASAFHNPNRSQDWVCSVCGKSFFAKGGLTYHFDSTHKPESEWHLKCPKCPRRFYRSTLMHLHTKKCDGSGTTKDEENGGAVEPNRKRGLVQPRKGGRQKKKKMESDEEEEEMEDKSTTEDEEEMMPSTSSSSQVPKNEFQEILNSSAYQQSQMWTGTGP